LYPQDRDLFGDLITDCIAVLVSSLDTLNGTHIRTMVFSFDDALTSIRDEFMEFLRPHLPRLLDQMALFRDPEALTVLLRLHARLANPDSIPDLISAYLNSTSRAMRMDGMTALGIAHPRLSEPAIAGLLQDIVRRIISFGVGRAEFHHFLEVLGTVLRPSRAALAEIALPILRDIVTGRSAVVRPQLLPLFFPVVLALAEGCLFRRDPLFRDAILPFAIARLEAQPHSAAEHFFDFCAAAFDAGALTTDDAREVIARAIAPEMRAEAAAVARCLAAALRSTDIRADMAAIGEWARNAGGFGRALLIRMGAGELHELAGGPFPREARGIAEFMRAIIERATVADDRGRAVIARRCYEFLALPSAVVAESGIQIGEVVSCVREIDPEMNEIQETMQESPRQRQAVRRRIEQGFDT
jgi:hypothetical protein